MKHLRKFFEDNFYKDELIDSLAYFNDKYGDPLVSAQDYNTTSKMFTLTWDIGIDLSTFENVTDSLQKLQELAVDMEHILTARDRHRNYNFYTSITNKLKLKIIPIVDSSNEYNFIQGQHWREVKLNLSEIERFFNSKDITIARAFIDDNEGMEQSSVEITFNKRFTNDIIEEFYSMFEDEYNNKMQDGTIDREITLRAMSTTSITFIPDNEKTYVTY